MTKERQLQYDIAYMKMAKAIGELSYGIRNKVGCIIVSKNGQVISQGFNGTPTGYNNCCEDPICSCKYVRGCAITEKPIEEQMSVEFCANALKPLGHANDKKGFPCQYLSLTTKKEVLHAESNAIAKCAKWISSTEGATLYVTLSPCFDCSKIIIQAGITRVCYCEEYRDKTGIDFLKKNGIIVNKIKIDNDT